MTKKLKPTATNDELVAALRERGEALGEDNYHSEASLLDIIASEIEDGNISTVYDVVKLLIENDWH